MSNLGSVTFPVTGPVVESSWRNWTSTAFYTFTGALGLGAIVDGVRRNNVPEVAAGSFVLGGSLGLGYNARQIHTLKNDNTRLIFENNGYTSLLMQNNTAMKNMNETLKQLEKERKEAVENLLKKSEELKKLAAEIKQVKAEKEKLQNEFNTLKVQIKELDVQIKSLSSEKDIAKKALNDGQENQRKIEEQRKDGNDNDAVRLELDNQKKLNGDLQSRLNSLEGNLEQNNQVFRDREAALKKREDELRSKQDEMHGKEHSFTEGQKDLEKLQAAAGGSAAAGGAAASSARRPSFQPGEEGEEGEGGQDWVTVDCYPKSTSGETSEKQ